MTPIAIVFFTFGALFLWGGLAITLRIAIKGDKK
jgi:hypothetical protein